MRLSQFFILASFLLGCYSSLLSQSQVLIISPNGDDTNAGVEAHPLKSFEGARNRIRELRKDSPIKDTIFVIIKPGVYELRSPIILKPEDSGQKSAPIVYMAEDEENTIFTGGFPITGFVEDDDGLWVTKVPQVAYWNWTFDQLYVNGKRAVRAKSPNKGYFHIKDVVEEVWVKGSGRNPEKAQQIVDIHEDAAQQLDPLSTKEVDQVVMTVFHHWNITKRHIDKYDSEEDVIYTSGQGMKPWNPWKSGKRFILENYKDALDVPGEWFLKENGTLYYKPLPEEKIETTQIIAPVLEQLIKIDGNPQNGEYVEHVIFKNLHFRHSADYLPESGFEPYQAAISIAAAIELNGAQHIKFINCLLNHTGGYGLWLNQAVSKCEVKHCHLNDLGAGGIRIGELDIRDEEYLQTHSNIIDNNIIQSGGFEFAPGVGVLIGQSADNQITHNDISDFRYTGVSVGWRWGYDYSPAKRNKILYNHIHHIGWGVLSDMSGVYTLGPSEGTEVSNNHIHHIYAYDYGGWGLYTDEGSSNIVMENNLVHHTKTGGFHQHYGRENIIRNNIFAFSKMYQLQATRVEDHRSFSFTDNIVLYNEGVLYKGPWIKMNVEIDNNLYWNLAGEVDFIGENIKTWRKSGYDQHSRIQDPNFVNPQLGDFSFKNSKASKKINFKPFDYTTYGVYGSEEWKNSTKLSDATTNEFNALFE